MNDLFTLNQYDELANMLIEQSTKMQLAECKSMRISFASESPEKAAINSRPKLQRIRA